MVPPASALASFSVPRGSVRPRVSRTGALGFAPAGAVVAGPGMFEKLTERLGDVFGRLTRRGALTEADVDAALREVRIALLEADVALPVARDFLAKIREKAVGETVLKSDTPGQMVVKIVHDALVEALGGAGAGLDLNAPAPVIVMLVGLQGSGKTT